MSIGQGILKVHKITVVRVEPGCNGKGRRLLVAGFVALNYTHLANITFDTSHGRCITKSYNGTHGTLAFSSSGSVEAPAKYSIPASRSR